MHKQLDEILQKKMDRKDFLRHVALGFAIITGTAGIIKMLKPGALPQIGQNHANSGYGSSPYGGHPTAKS